MDGLTARQAACLRLAAAGYTERAVALELGISVATVRGHLARARQRLGARSTAQAAVLAVVRGLIVASDIPAVESSLTL
jgi:DNA-binding CsgD family transcriptional regulator